MSRQGTGIAEKLALLVLAPLVVLGTLEALAWTLGVEPRANEPDHQAGCAIELCRWDPSHLERCELPPRLVRRQIQILVYGGSDVFGHPFGETRTIPSYLQEELDDAYQPSAYFVRNLALPCKDSSYVASCVERSIGAADLIVIYSGHNDFGGYLLPYPRIPIFVRDHLWLLDLRNAMSRTRIYSLLRRFPVGDLPPARFAPDPSWDLAAASRIVLDHYERNVTRALDLAQARGIPAILVTIVSNLSEFPFPREEWDFLVEHLRGLRDPPRWLAHYAHGIELERAGERAASLEAFRASRDLVFPAFRAHGALNDVIREIARGREGVHLVDFEAELDQLGLEEGIGCNFFGTEVYCDGVHTNPRTNRLIADAIFREIHALYPPRSGSPARPVEPPPRAGGSRPRPPQSPWSQPEA